MFKLFNKQPNMVEAIYEDLDKMHEMVEVLQYNTTFILFTLTQQGVDISEMEDRFKDEIDRIKRHMEATGERIPLTIKKEKPAKLH